MSKPFKTTSTTFNAPTGSDRTREVPARVSARSDSSRSAPSGAAPEAARSSGVRSVTTVSHSLHPTSDSTALASARRTIDPAIKPYTIPKDEPVYNIDDGDENSSSQCTEYVDDVYKYYKELEGKWKVSPNYLARQPSLSIRLREASVDFIVQLHRHISQAFEQSLQLDTLFLAISIFDRFLSRRVITAEKLNLTALGSFYVACKFEETYYPTVDQMLKFVPAAGRKDDVLLMERLILSDLKYTLGAPTAVTFLKRFAKASYADSMMGMVARFICEHSLLSYTLTTNYPPSLVAAASIAHSLRVLQQSPWTATLQHYSGYRYEDILPCMSEMREHVRKAPQMKYHTIFKKYSDQRYLKAALYAVQKI